MDYTEYNITEFWRRLNNDILKIQLENAIVDLGITDIYYDKNINIKIFNDKIIDFIFKDCILHINLNMNISKAIKIKSLKLDKEESSDEIENIIELDKKFETVPKTRCFCYAKENELIAREYKLKKYLYERFQFIWSRIKIYKTPYIPGIPQHIELESSDDEK